MNKFKFNFSKNKIPYASDKPSSDITLPKDKEVSSEERYEPNTHIEVKEVGPRVLWPADIPDKPLCLFDLEADSLDPTKINVVSYSIKKTLDSEWSEVTSLYGYTSIKELFDEDYVFVGHNIILWDLPCALRKILKIEKDLTKVIDTLWISRYVCPNLQSHGLDAWGLKTGIHKPKIEDWETASIEELTDRCEMDVKNNCKVFDYLFKKLNKIYKDKDSMWSMVWYLSFMASIIEKQHTHKILLDKEHCENMFETLSLQKEDIITKLKAVMPSRDIYKTKEKPKKCYKKDATLSSQGQKWFDFLELHELPKDHTEPVLYVHSSEEGNPNSVPQIKKWLFDLGWKPATFKYERETDGSTRKIEQLRVEGPEGKELCPSVLVLAKKHKEIELLTELSTLTHRIGLFKGFLKTCEDNQVVASYSGITNTLRGKHKIPVCNLPGVHRPYGKEVRQSLIARPGKVLLGTDLSSLEDMTKRNFIYPYDPSYVESMSDPEYDPHLEISVMSGLCTKDEVEFFKWYKKQ